jgi:hypothetical protein
MTKAKTSAAKPATKTKLNKPPKRLSSTVVKSAQKPKRLSAAGSALIATKPKAARAGVLPFAKAFDLVLPKGMVVGNFIRKK